METHDFPDAALLLVGYGSTRNDDSQTPVWQHAAQLRQRKIFAQVQAGFWKQEPDMRAVLDALATPRVFIVPLSISEGYFTQEVIPTRLGFRAHGQSGFAPVQLRRGQRLYYCGPVGTHDSMTNVLLARAQDIIAQHPFLHAPLPRDLTLFIAGHGTGKNENSRHAIERQVERIRAQHLYAGVHGVFLEEDPRIGDCYRLAQTRNLVVVPLFISDGLHSREDIPRLLGESARVVQERVQLGQPTWRNPTERHGKHVWYTASIGSEPHIAEVILERVREAASKCAPVNAVPLSIFHPPSSIL